MIITKRSSSPRGVSAARISVPAYDVLTYNRYAHVNLVIPEGSDVTFTLHQPDLYSIGIDPRSDLWRQLGTPYVVLPGETTDAEFLKLATLVSALPSDQMWIYRYRWGTAPLRMSLH